MSKEQSIEAYDDAKTKTIRYKVNGVDITSSVEILKEQFLNQWNNEHKITTELSFYERNKYAKQVADLQSQLALTEKALELAVETIFEEFGCSKYYNKTCKKGDLENVCYQCLKEEYLQRAREMMKSE